VSVVSFINKKYKLFWLRFYFDMQVSHSRQTKKSFLERRQ
jgi:hypothetical protein